MQGNMPSFINGITFERLSLGTVPFSILGVRHNPSLNSDHLGIGAQPPGPAAADLRLTRQRVLA